MATDESREYSHQIETGATNAQVEIAYAFESRGTEAITINDEMITTEAAAQERAESIMLDQSYTHRQITINIPHTDGMDIGHIIDVRSKLYKIIGITETIEGPVVGMQIIAKRWE